MLKSFYLCYVLGLCCVLGSLLPIWGPWQFWGANVVPRKGTRGLSLQWPSLQYGQGMPFCPYPCCEVLTLEILVSYYYFQDLAFKVYYLKTSHIDASFGKLPVGPGSLPFWERLQTAVPLLVCLPCLIQGTSSQPFPFSDFETNKSTCLLL